MAPSFLLTNTADGCRWYFNLDQVVKIRVSAGEQPKVAIEVVSGKSYALDREASADFLAKFEEHVAGR